MPDPVRELLDSFIRQLWSMHVQRSAEHGAALHKPLLMLVVLSVLERGRDGTMVFRFRDLEEEFRALWPRFGGRPSAAEPALPFFHLRSEPFWALDGVSEGQTSPPAVAVLRGDGVAGRLQPAELLELLRTNRAARLEVAEAILARWWPTVSARQLAKTLSLSRTHRILVVEPENFDICMEDGTWGAQSKSLLRKWNAGDALLFHDVKSGGLRATAVVEGDVYRDDAPLWQNMSGKAYPWRIRFRLIERLEVGVPTKQVLDPLRPGAPANWFNEFIQSSHTLTEEDAYALLDAFENALVTA